jgi:peptide deformylase
MKYPIRIYGDPVLRTPAEPIREVDDSIRALARDMLETMRAESGVGLAAQQIGKTIALCVVHVPKEYDVDEEGRRLNPETTMPLVLINPKLAKVSEAADKAEEGCLSFPDIRGKIPRAVEITVEFLDTQGQPRRLDLQRFAARVVQHEIDHLNGVLFIDRMSRVRRVAINGQLKRMKKETEVDLGIA